jgi:hypothetical protein
MIPICRPSVTGSTARSRSAPLHHYLEEWKTFLRIASPSAVVRVPIPTEQRRRLVREPRGRLVASSQTRCLLSTPRTVGLGKKVAEVVEARLLNLTRRTVEHDALPLVVEAALQEVARIAEDTLSILLYHLRAGWFIHSPHTSAAPRKGWRLLDNSVTPATLRPIRISHGQNQKAILGIKFYGKVGPKSCTGPASAAVRVRLR